MTVRETIDQIEHWLARAGADSVYLYHDGNLAYDRFYNEELDRVANYVLNMAERNRVLIFQRRVDVNRWRYEMKRI